MCGAPVLLPAAAAGKHDNGAAGRALLGGCSRRRVVAESCGHLQARVRVSVCCLSWTRSSQVTVRTGERERGGRQKRDRTCVGGPPALLSPEVFMIAWSDTLARCMSHITYVMLIHVTFGRKRSDGPEVRALEGARGWRVVR